VCDPKRNPGYSALWKQPPAPGTQISALWQEVLNRLAPLLTPEQIKIITLNLSDRSSNGRNRVAAQQRWARRRMMREYGAALAELNLPAPVLFQAKELLIQRSAAPAAVFAAAREKGEDPRSAQSRAAQKVATDAVTGELKALLGSDGYQRLEDLQETIPAQRMVESNEATNCRAAGCPLTQDQVRRLSAMSLAVRKSLPPRTPGALREEVDPSTGLTVRAAAILARSALFLSPAQQEALKIGYQDQAAIMNRIATSQPPTPKRYPPLASGARNGI